jgi:hypothetical protein
MALTELEKCQIIIYSIYQTVPLPPYVLTHNIFLFHLQKDQQTLKEAVDVLLIRFKFFYPDMFWHMVAMPRGSWLPDKLLKQCSMLWLCADYDPHCVASCCGMRFQAFSGFLIISSVSRIVNVMCLVVPVSACLFILCYLGDSIMAQFTQWSPVYKIHSISMPTGEGTNCFHNVNTWNLSNLYGTAVVKTFNFLHQFRCFFVWRCKLSWFFQCHVSLNSQSVFKVQTVEIVSVNCSHVRPSSWSSGQSFWLLIMWSRVWFPVLAWGFLLEGGRFP